MEKKVILPTIKVGNKRIVKKNLTKEESQANKLKKVIKSLGKSIQPCNLTQCSIETDQNLEIYNGKDVKAIIGKNRGPMGFIISGSPEIVDKEKIRQMSTNFEDSVNKLNIKEEEETQKPETNDETPDID